MVLQSERLRDAIGNSLDHVQDRGRTRDSRAAAGLDDLTRHPGRIGSADAALPSPFAVACDRALTERLAGCAGRGQPARAIHRAVRVMLPRRERRSQVSLQPVDVLGEDVAAHTSPGSASGRSRRIPHPIARTAARAEQIPVAAAFGDLVPGCVSANAHADLLLIAD